MIVGSGAAERFHLRWFGTQLPERGVVVRPIATERVGFALAGPGRASCSRGSRTRTCPRAPFLLLHPTDRRRNRAGPSRQGLVHGRARLRDLRRCRLRARLYDALVEAGADLGLVHFGGRALNSLRLEKSFKRGCASTPRTTRRSRPASTDSSTSPRVSSSAAKQRFVSGTSRRAIAS